MENIFTLTCSAVPPSAQVVGFRGQEGLSRPYRIAVGVVLKHDADIDMQGAVGTPAALQFWHGPDKPPSVLSGIVGSIELAHEYAGQSVYEVNIVPRLWLATLTHHSRVFVGETIPQILEKVLTGSGVANYVLRLQQSYAPMEHVCQYQESNFAFVSRLMEREGIYYFFEHGPGGETLVLTDSRTIHEPFDGAAVRYVPKASKDDVSAKEALRVFKCRHSAVPANVVLKDYDYIKPTLDLAGAAPIAATGKGVISIYGENFGPGDAARIATARAQEYASRQVVYTGHGVAYFRPGYTFALEEHPRAPFNTSYLCTAVEHHGNLQAGDSYLRDLLGYAHSETYCCDVVAIAAKSQYRAERTTPVPRIDGVVSGVVDGAATSSYAQIDPHGRYKVKIFFDESDLTGGGASTWARMIQPHGGSPEGFHFPLRAGTEVLILFLGGDPDRPIICGVGPNALKPSPVAAGNNTRNVIQTGGKNRLEMEDTGGSQWIKLSTPTLNTALHMGAPNDTHNIVLRTQGRALFKIDQDQDIVVGKNLTEHVVGEVTETYDKSQDTTILKNQTVTITQDQAITLTDGNQSLNVQSGTQDLYVKKEQTITVDGAATHKFDNTVDLTIMGPETHTTTKALTTKIDGGTTETYGTKLDTKVDGPETHLVTGTLKTTVNGAVTEKFGPQNTTVIGAQSTLVTAACTLNAQTFTVIASGGETKITPAKWYKVASMSGEAVGLKMSAIGMKLEATGLAAGLVGIKLDVTGLKVDLVGLKIAAEALKMEQVAMHIRAGVLATWIYGMSLII